MNEYIQKLKPSADLSLLEIKGNYRKLVKENHPDLFPLQERREQNIILMEINEAYLSVLSENCDSKKEKASVSSVKIRIL